MELKDLLGGKGANLAEMTSVLELPVPPGFTITTDACRAYMASGWPEGPRRRDRQAPAALEKKMGKKLGDPADPLLVSVRSGAKFSMPGMMDTVLNLGLNDDSVEGLAKQTDDERFAYDSYRRFIAMYGRIVLDIDGEDFERPARHGQGVGRRRPPTRDRARRDAAPACASATRTSSQQRDRQALPAGPDGAAARARSRPCSVAGTARGPSPTATASASATTSAPP